MGGSSITDGSLEVMVHRRLLADDHRGVGEPLDETMCGGSGFGDCAGLTMRGTAFLVLDTVANAHAARRELVETLNFPPTLAFTKSAAVATPSMSALGAVLPPNVKLMTIANNYAAWNGGKLLLRFAHKYQAGEHPVLSQPASFSLATVFSKAGLKVASAQETTLTGNQERASWEAKKLSWPTEEVVDRGMSAAPQEQRHFLDPSDAAMQVTINAMEVNLLHITISLDLTENCVRFEISVCLLVSRSR
jgi:alpha-mannosidase